MTGRASKVEALPQTPPKASLWNPVLKSRASKGLRPMAGLGGAQPCLLDRSVSEAVGIRPTVICSDSTVSRHRSTGRGAVCVHGDGGGQTVRITCRSARKQGSVSSPLPSCGAMAGVHDRSISSRSGSALRRWSSVSHGPDSGREAPDCTGCHIRRTYSGRPSSSIWFRTATARAISGARQHFVRERSPFAVTRLNRLTSASTSTRQ